jgi:hypothetical protein
MKEKQAQIPGKCIDRFITMMYYEIPGKYDINNKLELIHGIMVRIT